MSAPMSRAEILALPPAIGLAELGLVLDRSEPTIRELHRNGRLAELGIRVEPLGAKYVVITSTVWRFLGIDPAEDGLAIESRPRRPAREGRPVTGNPLHYSDDEIEAG